MICFYNNLQEVAKQQFQKASPQTTHLNALVKENNGNGAAKPDLKGSGEPMSDFMNKIDEEKCG